jgi:Chaperone of endosialidase
MTHIRRTTVLLAVLCCSLGLIAQVTGSGTASHVARWTGSTALGNSNIVETNGSACAAAHGGQATQCVGIGTTTPTGNLHIVGGASTGLILESSVANGNPTISVIANTPAGAAQLSLSRADGGAPAILYFNTAGTNDWTVAVPDGTTEELDFKDTSGGLRMALLQGGFVGIGTNTPSNLLTLVQGGGPALADGWNTYSSRRFKTNIQPLVGALEKVEQIQGVSYARRADGKREIGVVAEDVDQVVPEVVSHDPKTHEVQGVDYSRLAALLIEAVKSQQAEIRSQEAEIQQLKAQIGRLNSNPAGQ